MKYKELKKKNNKEINILLNNYLREYFNLRMQRSLNQANKVHLFKNVKHNIARIKTLINERKLYKK